MNAAKVGVNEFLEKKWIVCKSDIKRWEKERKIFKEGELCDSGQYFTHDNDMSDDQIYDDKCYRKNTRKNCVINLWKIGNIL